MTGGEKVGRPANDLPQWDSSLLGGDQENLRSLVSIFWTNAWDWRSYALEQEDRAERAEEERDARRESLRQEIAEGLRVRGFWDGNGSGADLITAVAKALDESASRAEEAERKLDSVLSGACE